MTLSISLLCRKWGQHRSNRAGSPRVTAFARSKTNKRLTPEPNAANPPYPFVKWQLPLMTVAGKGCSLCPLLDELKQQTHAFSICGFIKLTHWNQDCIIVPRELEPKQWERGREIASPFHVRDRCGPCHTNSKGQRTMWMRVQ